MNSGRTEQTVDLGVGTDSVSPPAATARYNPAVRQISLAGGPGVANAACSGTVNWTLNYTYTDKEPKTYTATSSTSGTIGQTNNYTTPVGLGGQVVAKAQATLNGQQYNASVTFWVLGTPIPDNTITTRLCGLYSGATSGLLTGIAMHETGYAQFHTYIEMGLSGEWPYGNQIATSGAPLDSYVGLMQVPNGMTSSGGPAFDWYNDTSTGASIFNGKYSTVQSYVSSQQKGHPNLPNLSATQYEDNQLVLYGGYGTGAYIWVPNSTYTGWSEVTTGNAYNFVYAPKTSSNSGVRNGIQPE